MTITELTALKEAGTAHNFAATFGGRPEGARGTVVKVGAPLNPNVVWVRDIAGKVHNWDARTITLR